jgi:hypothetical protein
MIFSWKKILKVQSKMAPFIAEAAKRPGATNTV